MIDFFRRQLLGMILLGLAVAALAAAYVGRIAIDDAYITYRYAQNLAEHGRMVYNLDGSSAFATTAPGYAVVLAGLRLLGANIPLAGAIAGALGIAAGGWSLKDLLAALPFPTGLLAGLLLATSPLLWLVLGMEGVPALGLALLGLALVRRDRQPAAALALAAATFLRFDAVAAAAAWGIYLLAIRRWSAIRPLALYAGLVLLGYGTMYLLLGVPLPATLASKQAQVVLGISGFFPDTTWATGIPLLIEAYRHHSPFYLVMAFFVLVALLTLIAVGVRVLLQREADSSRISAGRHLPLLLLFLWAALHSMLYIAAGVTPYLWYYLPLLPLLVTLVALGILLLVQGIQRLIARPLGEGRVVVAMLLFLLTVPGPLASHAAMQARLDAGADLSEPTLETKVLPEAKVAPYRAAGEWLNTNVPANATVGVTEVGIMGYYGQRPMVDFLGLLDPAVADALLRGDLSWALYARQPDYLVLSDSNPMYGFDVFRDPWFQGAYEPVEVIPANGFWGGNLTIYRRRSTDTVTVGPVEELPPGVKPLSYRFGDVLELVGVSAPPGPWQPGEPAHFTLFWRVLKTPERDYTFFSHYWDEAERVIAARDAPPMLGMRPMTEWQPGELLAHFEPLGLPSFPWSPTTLQFGIGFYDPESGERLPAYDAGGERVPHDEPIFGERALLPPDQRRLMGYPGQAPILSLKNYRMASGWLVRGESMPVELIFSHCECPVEITLELWDHQTQQMVWEESTRLEAPGRVRMRVEVPADEPALHPELSLRASHDGAPLFRIDGTGRQLADKLRLTPIYLHGP